MRKFTNPLDNIRVASPCSADWNQMYGNERRRFCAECKLNVYNLSEMTRDEAENFLIASEGRVCVRYFRRADGTVLTKNCPVGWRAVKQRVSRTAAAAFSVMIGFVSGLFIVKGVDSTISMIPSGNVPPVELPADRFSIEDLEPIPIVGEALYPLTEVEGLVDLSEFRKAIEEDENDPDSWVVGQKSGPQKGKNSQF